MSPDAFELPKSRSIINDSIDSIGTLSGITEAPSELKPGHLLANQYVNKEAFHEAQQLQNVLNIEEITQNKEDISNAVKHDVQKTLDASNVSELTSIDHDEDIIIEDHEIGIDDGSNIDQQPLAYQVSVNSGAELSKGILTLHNCYC